MPRSAIVFPLLLVGALTAQAEPPLGTDHPLGIDSGVVRNDSTSPATRGLPAVVWSTLVAVPQSAWLRLTYGGAQLAGSADRGADGSFLRITSLRDGAQQIQHLRHVAEWHYTSAYFNGDLVQVELLAFPGTGDNRLVLDFAAAGPVVPYGPDTICGSTDDRVLSYDNRCARNQPTGCTSWLIDDCNHCFLTAGHCASGVNVVQFNVPLSSSSGALRHPPPQDQYSVDQTSKQTNGGQGVGNDWAYFGVFANSNTGLTPYQAYGGQTFALLAVPPAVSGQQIRITGYGSTTSPVSPTWYLVQKTHAGPYASFSGTTVRYATDTTGGNSGSPIVLDGTNQTLGIHTHGGCTATGGSNAGTGSNHPGLRAALAAPLGVCVCPQASWRSFGSGCAGANGVPAMQLVGLPALGSVFALNVQNLGSGVAAMLVGFAPQNVSLQPYGFSLGCNLLVNPVATELLLASGGTAGWSMSVPNLPGLAGLHLFQQVLELGTPSAVSAGGDAELR
jgi:hypothetical protein